ncbi:MAG: DNA repair protein RadA [Candidatus Gottesmanbacteria bacterium]
MKQRSSYVCQQCSAEFPQWYGKCPSCGEWNTLVETVKESETASHASKRFVSQSTPQKLSEVKHIEKNRLKCGLAEFDRVMGGGIVPGSVTLLAGDPGIGKSTLLLHVLSPIGGMYISGEESGEQIKLRAKRMGIDGENIMVFSETVLEGITEALIKKNPQGLVIVDSIQTISSNNLDGMAGSVGQIRYCAEELVTFAKSRGVPILIIGHVTKEGEIAGPKVLEHMVDTVLYLEGERYADARILRTLKNRFGPVEEVGIFEMKENGLKEIDNPSEIFLQDRVKNVPGSVITVIMEGTRPLLVEIQALVVPSQIPIPRRVANGFDYNKLQLLTAILQKRLGLPLGTSDVFINVNGGLKLTEPAADLAVALAIISSYKNISIDSKTIVFGEVGLLGEIRRVGQEERRMKEAKRLGFVTSLYRGTCTSLINITKMVGK